MDYKIIAVAAVQTTWSIPQLARADLVTAAALGILRVKAEAPPDAEGAGAAIKSASAAIARLGEAECLASA